MFRDFFFITPGFITLVVHMLLLGDLFNLAERIGCLDLSSTPARAWIRVWPGLFLADTKAAHRTIFRDVHRSSVAGIWS